MKTNSLSSFCRLRDIKHDLPGRLIGAFDRGRSRFELAFSEKSPRFRVGEACHLDREWQQGHELFHLGLLTIDVHGIDPFEKWDISGIVHFAPRGVKREGKTWLADCLCLPYSAC